MKTRQKRVSRIDVPLDIRADGDAGQIVGYGSVFNTIDSYRERVASGAFDRTLAVHKAAGTMPAMLWQHDAHQPIGVWTSMSEDEKGLRVEGQLATETVVGRDAHVLLKMGAFKGLSIGFMPKVEEYDADTRVTTLKEIDLWEVSLVTFPANSDAMVQGIKASPDDITTITDAERYLRDAGFTRAEAKAYIGCLKTAITAERDARQAAADFKAKADRLLQSLTA